MTFKCLRALPGAMAAEHRLTDDIALAAPGELLSIPVYPCRERNNPDCQCRRVFVGLSTGHPTTLARVCVDAEDVVEQEARLNPMMVSPGEAASDEPGVLLHDLQGIAYVLRCFEPGRLLRINRTNGAVYLEDTWATEMEKIKVMG